MEQSEVGKCKYRQNRDKRRLMGINCLKQAKVGMFEENFMQTTV